MSQEARNKLQDLKNEMVTQSHGWTAFKAAVSIAYIGAYNAHKGALDEVKKNKELDNEACWMIFSMLFGAFGLAAKPFMGQAQAVAGRWVGRLIEDVKVVDQIATEIYGEMLEKIRDEITGDDLGGAMVKGSKLLQVAEGADGTRALEPVAEDPHTYEKRMELMLAQLAKKVMQPVDDLIAKSDSMDVFTAINWVNRFRWHCPYMTDLPQDIGQSFIDRLQKVSERAMWAKWAAGQGAPHWRKVNQTTLGGMTQWDPVLERLLKVGAPLKEITSATRVGNGFWNSPARVLDMEKAIQWGKRNQPIPPADVERFMQLLDPKRSVSDKMRAAR